MRAQIDVAIWPHGTVFRQASGLPVNLTLEQVSSTFCIVQLAPHRTARGYVNAYVAQVSSCFWLVLSSKARPSVTESLRGASGSSAPMHQALSSPITVKLNESRESPRERQGGLMWDWTGRKASILYNLEARLCCDQCEVVREPREAVSRSSSRSIRCSHEEKPHRHTSSAATCQKSNVPTLFSGGLDEPSECQELISRGFSWCCHEHIFPLPKRDQMS